MLVMVRDALLAAALAWIGVTLEARAPASDQACAAESCERSR